MSSNGCEHLLQMYSYSGIDGVLLFQVVEPLNNRKFFIIPFALMEKILLRFGQVLESQEEQR